jgi:hypothetical protein
VLRPDDQRETARHLGVHPLAVCRSAAKTPIGPLRKTIHDIRLREYREKTVYAYVSHLIVVFRVYQSSWAMKKGLLCHSSGSIFLLPAVAVVCGLGKYGIFAHFLMADLTSLYGIRESTDRLLSSERNSQINKLPVEHFRNAMPTRENQ